MFTETEVIADENEPKASNTLTTQLNGAPAGRVDVVEDNTDWPRTERNVVEEVGTNPN